jgi:exosortase family protein XrtF
MKLLQEFKPALLFLGKFLTIYFVGNIVYGIYIESFADRPDPITRFVTNQSVAVLNQVGFQSAAKDHDTQPKIGVSENGKTVLYVFEGCNGINVMIVFIAFMFAFGGPGKPLAIFLPAGIITILLFNLLRIALLFYLALNNERHFYYYHKYLFTATLYLVTFGMWALWVIRFNGREQKKAAA